MKSKAIFMAWLTFSFMAQAVPVSIEQVKLAARAWADRRAVLGARIGTAVDRVATRSAAGNVTVHAVLMKGGGTIFMSSDTTAEPVVLFTSDDVDLTAVDEASPLWALLRQDADVRLAAASAQAAGSAPSVVVSACEDRWAALLAEGELLERGVKLPSRAGIATVSDLRVDKLIQSKWNQSKVGSKDCYNRFTPLLSTGDRALCGCVATAMSQLMRYHQYPMTAVTPVTRKCYVQASTKGNPAAVKGLTTEGGVYDWGKMPLVPGSGITDAQCEAIGKLTSDAGISVYMSYDTSGAGGSGAFMFNVVPALKDVFGFANADFYSVSSGSVSPGVIQKAMLSNFDAGYPVLMGIRGTGGHAIVGDGYGYSSDKLYVHLNMGWSGSSDLWYNLPDIGTSYMFDVFDDLVFNIFPEVPAASVATLSGRATDDDGQGLAAEVKVYKAGTDALVTGGETSSEGVYGFLLPAGTYDVRVEKPGYPVEEILGVSAPETVSEKRSRSGIIAKSPQWIETYADRPCVTKVGNAWGQDLQMTQPLARIITNGVELVYSSLDKAIVAGRAIAETEPKVSIEILGEIELAALATIDFPCLLTATNENPSASQVIRKGTAALSVAPGACLILSNLAFSASTLTAVSVSGGGRLVLSADVDLGVASGVGTAVRTASADGLELAAGLTTGFTIDCAVAPAVGDVFGRATCDYRTASDCAAMIANSHDAYGEIRGVAGEEEGLVLLKWAEIPVPPEEAVGYFVDKDGTTNATARLDRLLERFEQARADGLLGTPAEIVFNAKPGLSLSRPLTVTSDLTLCGKGDVVLSDISGTAGFTVTGGRLTVNGIAFRGYKGNGLFVVNGDAAALTLGSNVAFVGIEGTNYHSGAVAVLKGQAKVNGTSFADCFASGAYDPTHTRSSYGGAVYIGQNCSLELNGGSITGCRAATDGGGVYAWAGSAVSVGGDLTVSGNTSGGKNAREKSDDIGLRSGTVKLVLANEVKEGEPKRIGVRCGATCSAGAAFATVAAGVSKAAATKSAEAFLNDHDPTLCATVSADGKSLQWTAAMPDYRTDDPDLAVIRIRGRGEPVDGDYWSVNHAFEALTNGTGAVTAELLKGATFARDIPVGCPIVFRSAGTEPLTLTNDGDIARILVSAAGQLTLTNLVLNGGSGSAGLIRVESGKLTLESGARIEDVVGLASRDSGAVSVWNHGTFVMKPGAEIVGCSNLYWNAGTEGGYCGGLLFDASTATITGGAISNCTAGTAGGAFFGNGSEASISGPVFICGNSRLDGAADDLRTADLSRLRLTDVFTGSIGVTEGALSTTSDPNVFGEVAASFSGDDDALANSARRFRHDVNGDYGQAVRGHGKTLLVWGSAIADGKYVAPDGTEYAFVAAGDPVLVEAPAAVSGLVYTGFEQIGVPEGIGYLIVGNRATEVGGYTATATPRDGFAWSPDGKTAPSNIVWTIAAPPEPDPQWEVVTNVPEPIAFRSIRRVDAPETAWELEITNRVPYCNYRLIWTEDLSKGFTTTGAWEQAVGEESAVRVWTTNVVTTGAALFWRAEGAEGTNWVLKAEQ